MGIDTNEAPRPEHACDLPAYPKTLLHIDTFLQHKLSWLDDVSLFQGEFFVHMHLYVPGTIDSIVHDEVSSFRVLTRGSTVVVMRRNS